MEPNEQPHVPVDELSEEQRAMLEQVERKRRTALVMENLQEQVQREANRQNRWVETQIWETDWTEVEVVDIVTLHPVRPMDDPLPDLKAYRYANEEDAPGGENHPGDDVGYYSRQRGRRGQVQRVTRDKFRELVEEEGVEPPDYVDATPDVGGERGPTDDDEAEEFDREAELQKLREERLDDMEDA